MAKKYVVSLDDQQRERLRELISSGSAPAREQAHARALLRSDAGDTDEGVAGAVEVSVRTVERVRKLFAAGGLDAGLPRRPQPPRPARRRSDGDGEARLAMLACSKPPEGRGAWTMQPLAGRTVELRYVGEGGVSDETVRRRLRKTRPSRG